MSSPNLPPSPPKTPVVGLNNNEPTFSASPLLRYKSDTVDPSAFEFWNEYSPGGQRTRKLNKFFGEEIYADIAPAEIEKYGLKAMLRSKVPLAYFFCHMLQDHCSENLFFYLEVEHYEATKFKSLEEQKSIVKYIFENYLNPSSKLEVNIQERVKKEIVRKFAKSEDLDDIFDGAKIEIFRCMEATYHSFQSTRLNAQLKEEIDNQNVFTNKGRRRAKAVLIRYLESYVAKVNVNGTKSNLNEHDLYIMYKNMITEFMRRVLEANSDDIESLLTSVY